MSGLVRVLGLGPGTLDECTPRALAAMEEADVLVGYSIYIDLVRERFPHKPTESTGMTLEVERCRRAVELARSGKNVAVVCSGDPGVYGMAGLVLQLCGTSGPEVEIIPGVTAACSAAARLGAPLGHDFAVVSLSDRLTPWSLIERRLDAAAAADFILCLYNPASRGRPDVLRLACDRLLICRSGETPAGWVRNIGRPGESVHVGTLEQLRCQTLDMFTTVIIGNSQTKRLNGRLVAPRGYREAEA